MVEGQYMEVLWDKILKIFKRNSESLSSNTNPSNPEIPNTERQPHQEATIINIRETEETPRPNPSSFFTYIRELFSQGAGAQGPRQPLLDN